MIGAMAAEGVGGAELSLFVGGASGAGGVGRGGGGGIAMPFGLGASEADESNRGRAEARCTMCEWGLAADGATVTPPAFGCESIVGEEVGCRWYFGRCWCLRLWPPGDGSGGSCPVFMMEMLLGCSVA